MRQKLCTYHKTGIPSYALGARFYAPGCEMCERKLATGQVSAADPSPTDMRDRLIRSQARAAMAQRKAAP